MDTLTDKQEPASTLGFAVIPADPPETPPEEKSLLLAELEYANTLATDVRVSFYEELIRQNSLHAVRSIQSDLAKLAVNPLTPVPQKLQIAEFQAKLAKLDRKQLDQRPGTPGFQLIINLGDTTETHRSVTVEQIPEQVEDA